ncbi:MAG TPA: hypothetical protein DEV87_01790, partial [Clostridiales bacterium]|nr:hypothetical protein [Clostridiales bacterium]
WAIEKLSNASGKSLDVTVNLFVSTDRFTQINQLTIIKIRSTTSIIIFRFLIFFTILYLAIIKPIPTNSDLSISYYIINLPDFQFQSRNQLGKEHRRARNALNKLITIKFSPFRESESGHSIENDQRDL